MRDLLLAGLLLCLLPFCFFKPHFGVLVYAWIGLMNPHRLSYAMSTAPVGLAVALATILGTFLTGAARKLPMLPTTALLVLWIGYTTATTIDALSPEAWTEWHRFSRIILMCFVAMMLMQERKRLEMFLFVCMASIAFYGIKGGIFSLATGGNYRVWGPPGSFITGNNELALAELMVLPLMLYFLRQTTSRWQRLAYYATLFLTVVSIIFSYSRGAFVAFAGLAAVMIARSRYRFQAFLILLVLGTVFVSLVPEHWTQRMFSITEYEVDESAMGRINAWHFAFNVAKDRLFGGGFRTFTPELFLIYAPNPWDLHDAHSIYFEVLAEQGFPGLFLFLCILGFTLWRLERLRRLHAKGGELRWASDLAEMIQFSVIAYMLGGAFLGLAYFDLYYYFVIAAILLEHIAVRAPAKRPELAPAAAPARRAPDAAPAT